MKIKSKSSINKRFKLTGKNKIKRKYSNMRHILYKKSKKRKRKLNKYKLINTPSIKKYLKRILK